MEINLATFTAELITGLIIFTLLFFVVVLVVGRTPSPRSLGRGRIPGDVRTYGATRDGLSHGDAGESGSWGGCDGGGCGD